MLLRTKSLPLAVVLFLVASFCGQCMLETTPLLAEERVSQSETDSASQRRIAFTYAGSIKKLVPGANVRMWIPIPPSNEHQEISSFEAIFPAKAKETSEKKYGNQMFYIEFRQPDEKSGAKGDDAASVDFKVSYDITRKSVRGLVREKTGEQKSKNDESILAVEERSLYLDSNRMVPISGKPQKLISDFAFTNSKVEVARKLYDVVYGHLNYDKSKPGYGNGDVIWACDSKTGNCTDFHSVFISLCRIREIPAKFEIGFPIPPERGSGEIGGYHCWAQFHDDKRGWVPVDISEADKHPEKKEFFFGNLDENRVQFSTGRDIELAPKQGGEPLNYFVYPYIEVDGEVWPKEKIKLNFSYADKPSGDKAHTERTRGGKASGEKKSNPIQK